FTPDLLPSDITGVSVFHPETRRFEFLPGPVFTDVLLADEINRTSPRTQSSLLEVMEERQVTVDGTTHRLGGSFFVIATQNPIELEGTHPLPEAQIDRFLMLLRIGYPSPEEEVRILAAQVNEHPIDRLEPVLELAELERLQREVLDVRVSQEIQEYIVEIATATREIPEVRVGVSPRGSLALMRAAQAYAFLEGESFVSPDAIKSVAVATLAHRLVLDSYRESAGTSREEIIARVLERVSVPTEPASSREARLDGSGASRGSASFGDGEPQGTDSARVRARMRLRNDPP
ncbi:MAG TPA: MoxR family ATPase, partial [Planctomycetota bacterium]|nr:MoxR family ATPase [Planctomycetota bacterium]